MSVQIQCPKCERRYTLADTLIGKRIRCKDCQTVIEVPGAEPREESANSPRDAVRAGTPLAPSRQRAREDNDDDDYDRPRQRRKRSRQESGSSAIIWVVGICCGLVVAVIAGVLAWVLLSKKMAAQPHMQAPLEVKRPGKFPLDKIDAKLPQDPVQAADPGPPGVYGDQGGDPIAPADPHLPNTVLRARAEDTFYKLSNPRIGRPKFGPGQALFVDFEVTRRGKFGGGSLIIHGGDGRRTQVALIFFGQRDRDTIEVKTFGPFGSFPQNAELYMVRVDGRYGPQAPTFKVSNSVTMGVMPTSTKARNWTQDEIDRYTKEPPNYTAANVHPDVGRDTAWAGDTKGGAVLRYVEPKGHLLGLEYQVGEWDKEKCIGRLTPIFTRDQPTILAKRVVAKDGYAVAGAQVHSGKFVDAVKLLFQRVKADGTLDPADAYASDWIGYPGAGQPTTLAGNGHRVLGINAHQGAILNGLALVTDEAR